MFIASVPVLYRYPDSSREKKNLPVACVVINARFVALLSPAKRFFDPVASLMVSEYGNRSQKDRISMMDVADTQTADILHDYCSSVMLLIWAGLRVIDDCSGGSNVWHK